MKTTKLPLLNEAVKRAWVEASRLLTIALVLLPVSESSAASSDAWEQFRIDVEAACLALAGSLDQPNVIVDPFGTESYGVALLIGTEKGGKVQTYACVYEKSTKRAELSGPFDTPIVSTTEATGAAPIAPPSAASNSPTVEMARDVFWQKLMGASVSNIGSCSSFYTVCMSLNPGHDNENGQTLFNAGLLNLSKFEKTNGQVGKFAGFDVYIMHYRAEIEILREFSWDLGRMTSQRGLYPIEGTIEFTRTENGWVNQGGFSAQSARR